MKNVKEIDWDNYLSTMTYETVRVDLVASIPGTPTMFSPDKDLIYLQTYDVGFETDNVEILNEILKELYDSLLNEARTIDWSFKQLYLLEVDYLTVMRILADKEALPEDYKYPKYYFINIMKMIGTGSSTTTSE